MIIATSLPEKVSPFGVIFSHVLSLCTCQLICPPPALVRVIVLCELVPCPPAPRSMCEAGSCNCGCVITAALLSSNRNANILVASRNRMHEVNSKTGTARSCRCRYVSRALPARRHIHTCYNYAHQLVTVYDNARSVWCPFLLLRPIADLALTEVGAAFPPATQALPGCFLLLLVYERSNTQFLECEFTGLHLHYMNAF